MNRILKSICLVLIIFFIIYIITLTIDYISLLSLLYTRYLTTFFSKPETFLIDDTLNAYINAHYSDENYFYTIVRPKTILIIFNHILFSITYSTLFSMMLLQIFIKSSILYILNMISSNIFMILSIMFMMCICFCSFYFNRECFPNDD